MMEHGDRELRDEDLKQFIEEARDYLVQLLFAIGCATKNDSSFCGAPISDGINQYKINFGWHIGHGGSLNIRAGLSRSSGTTIDIPGRSLGDWNSSIDRDTFRVIPMSQRYKYGIQDTLRIASAIELFISGILPQARWWRRYGICQSSFHKHINRDSVILSKWGDKWLCDDCVESLSLPAPIYHRTGETSDERSERDKMTTSLRWNILERDRFTCQSCGRTPPDVKLHVDHKIPIAMGGKTVVENLHTLCAECNLGKSAKMPSQATMEFWEQVHP